MVDQRIIVEQHQDGYVAYGLGLKGVVSGEGDTYDEAVADVESAIKLHIETFGDEVKLSRSDTHDCSRGFQPTERPHTRIRRMSDG